MVHTLKAAVFSLSFALALSPIGVPLCSSPIVSYRLRNSLVFVGRMACFGTLHARPRRIYAAHNTLAD